MVIPYAYDEHYAHRHHQQQQQPALITAMIMCMQHFGRMHNTDITSLKLILWKAVDLKRNRRRTWNILPCGQAPPFSSSWKDSINHGCLQKCLRRRQCFVVAYCNKWKGLVRGAFYYWGGSNEQFWTECSNESWANWKSKPGNIALFGLFRSNCSDSRKTAEFHQLLRKMFLFTWITWSLRVATVWNAFHFADHKAIWVKTTLK